MNGKQSKKVRQLFRRDVKRDLKDIFLGRFFKTKPALMPRFAWHFVLRIVLLPEIFQAYLKINQKNK